MADGGSPSFAQWVTREAAVNVESVFAVPIIIARHQRIDRLAGAIALECQIAAYSLLALKKRTPEAIIDDPYLVNNVIRCGNFPSKTASAHF